MPDTAQLDALLACPRCAAQALRREASAYACEGCDASFPDLGGIPWLFAEPGATLGEWRLRLARLLSQLDYQARSLREELAGEELHALTRRRLAHLLASYVDHAERVRSLLAPLELGSMPLAHEIQLALRTRLPARQGLTTYYANVHRDWAWGDEENAAALELVSAAIAEHPPGRVLVLGAGACRLAYDLHRARRPELTIALDINPLLLLLAQQVVRGETVALYEFPIAPRSIDEHAVLRSLRADEPVDGRFHFVFADAQRAPFAAGSFDTVVTPWLIDILSEDLREFAPRINGLLRPGGRWINFGSLAFAHENYAPCYSLEEIDGLVREAGFAAPHIDESVIPYMCSPASRHARRESAIVFAAVKERDMTAPPHRALPGWLVDGSEPVPLLQSFQTQAVSTRIHAFIMSLIDGRRSLKDMARVLAEQRLMTRDEAEPALRSFLIKMYEETLRDRNF